MAIKHRKETKSFQFSKEKTKTLLSFQYKTNNNGKMSVNCERK